MAMTALQKKAGLWGAAIGGVLGLAMCTTGASGSSEETDQTVAAEGHCQDWVNEQLKAPATADFTTTSTTGTGQGPWTFAGTVDAENSFGAKMRNQWECEVSLGDGVFDGRSRVF